MRTGGHQRQRGEEDARELQKLRVHLSITSGSPTKPG
jgi:hypothetical protein